MQQRAQWIAVTNWPPLRPPGSGFCATRAGAADITATRPSRQSSRSRPMSPQVRASQPSPAMMTAAGGEARGGFGGHTHLLDRPCTRPAGPQVVTN